MKFLITGLPRIRSAWLAALFSTDNVRCFHDPVHHGGPDRMMDAFLACQLAHVGICDPAAACAYPELALRVFHNHPIILIRRDEDDCRAGLENWIGAKLTHWDEILKNYRWFLNHPTRHFMWIRYEDLDNFEVVSQLFLLCTGQKLDIDRFALFNTLKIEQHYEKAAIAARSLKH